MKIEININESKEIDYKPKETKIKRRKQDDYDYADPFIEPLENEDDPVELECKLSDFYVFCGKLPADSKKVLKEYSKVIKREGKDQQKSTPKKKKGVIKEECKVQQELLYKKFKEETNEQIKVYDIIDYFLYDLIIVTHKETSTEKLLEEYKIKLKELFKEDSEIVEKNMEIEVLNKKVDELRIKTNAIYEKIKEWALNNKDKAYDDDFLTLIIGYIEDEFKLFYLLAFIAGTKKMSEEYVKRNVYNKISMAFDNNLVLKSLGYYIYRFKERLSKESSAKSEIDISMNDSINYDANGTVNENTDKDNNDDV